MQLGVQGLHACVAQQECQDGDAHVFVPVGVQRRGAACLLLHTWLCVHLGVQGGDA